jgi:hypothetical protein
MIPSETAQRDLQLQCGVAIHCAAVFHPGGCFWLSVLHTTMGIQELWTFAIIVTGNVAGVAADAIHEPYAGHTRLSSAHILYIQKIRMMNLSYLAAKLIGVKHALASPQSSQERTIAKRLPALLAQLEHVCTVCAQLHYTQIQRDGSWLIIIAAKRTAHETSEQRWQHRLYEVPYPRGYP